MADRISSTMAMMDEAMDEAMGAANRAGPTIQGLDIRMLRTDSVFRIKVVRNAGLGY